MTEHEWSVMGTDGLLAALCLLLAWRLRKITDRRDTTSRAFVYAFTASAIAAGIGGLWHGIGPSAPDTMQEVLRFLSYAFVSVGGTFLLWGVVRSRTRNTEHRSAYQALCFLKLALVVILFLSSSETRWIVASGAADIFVIACIGIVSAGHWWTRSFGYWLCAGAAISVIAGGIQIGLLVGCSGTLHNDLFHLLQMPAMYAFYRAARKS